MSNINAQFKDFVLVSIDETYYDGFEFAGTFADTWAGQVNLTDVELKMTTDDGESVTMTIQPYKDNEYSNYKKKGEGLSTEILIDVVNHTIAADITLDEFLDFYSEKYGFDYIVRVSNRFNNAPVYSMEVTRENVIETNRKVINGKEITDPVYSYDHDKLVALLKEHKYIAIINAPDALLWRFGPKVIKK